MSGKPGNSGPGVKAVKPALGMILVMLAIACGILLWQGKVAVALPLIAVGLAVMASTKATMDRARDKKKD